MPDIAPVSKLLDSVLEDIYEGLVKSAAISLGRHAQAMDLFQRARQRYFDTLETQYGNIRILGMSAPMPIDSLFIPVRVTEDGGSRRYMDS